MSEPATKQAVNKAKPRPEIDYYVERGCVVFTAAYLLRRGACCGSGCRHCPYEGAEKVLPKKVI